MIPANSKTQQNESKQFTTTTLDLLRHGEVQGGSCFRGRTDDPLTAPGWQQMQQASAGHDWDIIISSPLSRCLDFARWLSDRRNLPLSIISGFSEIDFGDWEGKTAEQIEALQPGALMHFYNNPDKSAPGNGESLTRFSRRVFDAWQQIISEYEGKRLLVITHAGVIRMIFSHLLEISMSNSFSIQVEHACMSRFQHFKSAGSSYSQFISHQNISCY